MLQTRLHGSVYLNILLPQDVWLNHGAHWMTENNKIPGPNASSLLAKTKRYQEISATVARTEIESTKTKSTITSQILLQVFVLKVMKIVCKIPGVFQEYREIMFFRGLVS